MITALDHMVLLCPDIEAGVEAYRVVMGADPIWRARSDGTASAVFAGGNTALELIAPNGKGATADKLREMTSDGAKLTTLVYKTEDITETHRVLTRRGLAPAEIVDGSSKDLTSRKTRTWRSFRIPDERMSSIKSFVLELNSTQKVLFSTAPNAVSRLDHLVINTPNPERAVATYGSRLGLRLALDRTALEWKTRFSFFRLGGLTLEIVHRLEDEHDPSGPDTFWGVTWGVADLDAAHIRLSLAGRDVSEVRTGRKPGSRVFTVRDGTLGVPTLFIDHAPR